MIQTAAAQTGDAFDHFITLAQEYVTWMLAEIPTHFPELDIDAFASDHDYDDMRKKFPGDHIPPTGCLLIALVDKKPCGCIALGRLNDTIGEVRTLFVRPTERGSGVGRVLVQAALDQARAFGYQTVRLDTLAFMTGAQTLYRSFGFVEIEPYLDISPSLRQYIRFFELKLSDTP